MAPPLGLHLVSRYKFMILHRNILENGMKTIRLAVQGNVCSFLLIRVLNQRETNVKDLLGRDENLSISV